MLWFIQVVHDKTMILTVVSCLNISNLANFIIFKSARSFNVSAHNGLTKKQKHATESYIKSGDQFRAGQIQKVIYNFVSNRNQTLGGLWVCQGQYKPR